MGNERGRAAKATRNTVRTRREEDALSCSSSSIDTLISRFRASATANRSVDEESEREESGSDEDDDEGFGDDNEGSTYDESPSLSPIEFSPIQPLPRPTSLMMSGRSPRSAGSPSHNAKPTVPMKKRNEMKQASQSNGAFFHRQEGSKTVKLEEVSPMPKLTQLPRTKPSLLLKPKTVTSKANSRVATPSPLKRKSPARPRMPTSPARTRHRSPTPVRGSPHRKPDMVYSDEEPDDELLSSLSPPSSESERATITPSSLDSLLDNDLETLHELISTRKQSGEPHRADRQNVAMKSWTSDDITAVLRQSTRFRSDNNQPTKTANKTTEAAGSSFRLRLDMLASPKQQKARSYEPRTTIKGSSSEEDDGSVVKELNMLSESFRKSQELVKKDKKESAPQKQSHEDKSNVIEINEKTTAKIREASDAIDKALLLALQPFEKMRKQQEQAEAEAAAKAAKEAKENPITSVADAEMPVASQRIVEQLDLAFGDFTKQRNDELKAIEDAAAAQKKAEEEKQKAEADAKAAADNEKRAQEMEVLRLLPLHGKLLTCSADIDEVLVQMEVMERQKHLDVRSVAKESPVSVADAILALRIETERKIQAIEAAAAAIPVEQADKPHEEWWETRQADLLRQNFVEHQETPITKEQLNQEEGNSLDDQATLVVEGEFVDIIQRDVVEKLELTMLKLRHVLSIDAKEAEEEAALKTRQEKEAIRLEQEKAAKEAKKRREEEDAESARCRVMGLSSIDQIHEWAASDAVLREESKIATLETPTSALGVGGPLWRAEFDHETELHRFQQLEQLMRSRDARGFENEAKVRFIDEHADHFTANAPSENQWDSLLEEQSGRDLDHPARSQQYRQVTSRLSSSYFSEHEPSVRSTRQLRPSKMPSRPRRDWTPPLPPPTSSTTSKRDLQLGKQLEQTIEQFQSDRRAKSRWFKQHVTIA